jgi:regulator of sirC expression with transglutaminase-like and TPR domain
MMHSLSPARQLFRRLIRQPETRLSLAQVALCIAWEDQGDASTIEELARIEAMVAALRTRITGLRDPYQIVNVVNTYLFDEQDFRGNTADYYNPTNSYLDQVLITRMGLPIMLSVIYLEVAWRLGLPVFGLALPGHFMVRYASADAEIFIDPFNRGRLWSRDDCEHQVMAIYVDADAEILRQAMAPPSKRAILTRVLRNLKLAYIRRDNFPRALAAVERILLLEPANAYELRDRGLLNAQLGRLHHALEDLERYVQVVEGAPELVEDAPELIELKSLAQNLAAQIAKGN